MIALGLLAASQTTGPPTVWTSRELRKDDSENAAIRREIARRFRATKSGDEARTLAAPFLAAAPTSAKVCYKAALALYYRSVILGYPTAHSDLARVWNLLNRLGDRSSPEHARVVCDLSGLCSYSWVRNSTARAVFDRYAKESDVVPLVSSAKTGAIWARNIPHLTEISAFALQRARDLRSDEVLDAVGKGPRARGTLLFMAGTGYSEGARMSSDVVLGRKAGALFTKILDDTTIPEDLRAKARIWSDNLASYRFMRGG